MANTEEITTDATVASSSLTAEATAPCSKCGEQTQYFVQCMHARACLSCGKVMAETKERCLECGVVCTRLRREYLVRFFNPGEGERKYSVGGFSSRLPPDLRNGHNWSLKNDDEANLTRTLKDETDNVVYRGRKLDIQNSKYNGFWKSKYYILVLQPDGCSFNAYPCEYWFDYRKQTTNSDTLADAEDKMEKREKRRVETIAKMEKRRRTQPKKEASSLPSDEDEDEDEDEVEKGDEWDFEDDFSDDEDGDKEEAHFNHLEFFEEGDGEAFLRNDARDSKAFMSLGLKRSE